MKYIIIIWVRRLYWFKNYKVIYDVIVDNYLYDGLCKLDCVRGPVKENYEWRGRNNQDTEELLKHEDIVNLNC